MEMEIIKGNQSEIKNTSKMKSILQGINRVDEGEDQITNIEDGVSQGHPIRRARKKKPRL